MAAAVTTREDDREDRAGGRRGRESEAEDEDGQAEGGDGAEPDAAEAGAETMAREHDERIRSRSWDLPG